ncbi:MAG TPA: phosphate signaling complex protein PhoU [Thermodesulfobacteriota bacterium]|nr:phosphate signaling complex protein PhoU [Thermodesulfobacteriota bacterium]
MPQLHTDRRYEEELSGLKAQLLRMGGIVERAIEQAVRALVERDSSLAQQTIDLDTQIDEMEVDIEERVTRILALHAPTARDLRFILTANRVSNDLERIGDLATSISERALELNREPQLKPYIDIPKMAEMSQRMVREALDAFVREDAELAIRVHKADDALDQLNDQIFRELLTYMMQDPTTIGRALRIIFVSKSLERIGDHATNIAEMVVFMTKGKVIKHMHVPYDKV